MINLCVVEYFCSSLLFNCRTSYSISRLSYVLFSCCCVLFIFCMHACRCFGVNIVHNMCSYLLTRIKEYLITFIGLIVFFVLK